MNSDLKHIAIVGATGAVGTLVRELLESRKVPHREITFLASARSAGQGIESVSYTHLTLPTKA